MKKNVSFNEFCDSFGDSYKDNFSYYGKQALFDYLEEWDKAIIRSKKIIDNSTLNNPLYCISKKASIRCMNSEESSLNGIIFFTETIKTIKAGFHEVLENLKIV